MFNLSRFKRFSWGKIWSETIDLCKHFDILQLWQGPLSFGTLASPCTSSHLSCSKQPIASMWPELTILTASGLENSFYQQTKGGFRPLLRSLNLVNGCSSHVSEKYGKQGFTSARKWESLLASRHHKVVSHQACIWFDMQSSNRRSSTFLIGTHLRLTLNKEKEKLHFKPHSCYLSNSWTCWHRPLIALHIASYCTAHCIRQLNISLAAIHQRAFFAYINFEIIAVLHSPLQLSV